MAVLWRGVLPPLTEIPLFSSDTFPSRSLDTHTHTHTTVSNMSGNNRDREPDDILDHICQNIRRFTDHHVSSMLHSIIGLPSMLTPPAGQTWVIIDEDVRSSSSTPREADWKRERAYSDGDGRLEGKTMEEVQRLKANWIAEREGNTGGGGGSNEAVEVRDKNGNTAVSSASSSSEASSSGGPKGERAIYVFRFPPSSSPDGSSDYYSPDAHRQIVNFHDQMFHSFFNNFHRHHPLCPFSSFFGIMNPFMFSPFWGLPRHYHHGYRRPMEEVAGADPFTWMREARREDTRSDDVIVARNNFPAQEQIQNTPPWKQTSHQIEPVNLQSETELDAYENSEIFDSWTDPSPSSSDSHAIATQGARTVAPRIVATSSSTQSRTLSDGSTFTKTVKITRYDDGTEEKIENEHTTPPSREAAGLIRDFTGDERNEDLWSRFVGAESVERDRGRVLDHVYNLRKTRDEVRGEKATEEPQSHQVETQVAPQQTTNSHDDSGKESGSSWIWFWK